MDIDVRGYPGYFTVATVKYPGSKPTFSSKTPPKSNSSTAGFMI